MYEQSRDELWTSFECISVTCPEYTNEKRMINVWAAQNQGDMVYVKKDAFERFKFVIIDSNSGHKLHIEATDIFGANHNATQSFFRKLIPE